MLPEVDVALGLGRWVLGMVLGLNGRILSSLCFLKFSANETPKEQCFGAVRHHGHE